MQSTLKIFATLATWLLLAQQGYAGISSETSSEARLEQQRNLFLSAENALQSGKQKEFTSLKKQLADYPLFPYLVYQDLKKNLHKVPAESVRKFLDDYQQTPLAKRLLSSWLRQLARQEKWQQFVEFYHDGLGVTLQCQHLTALLNTGQNEKAWPLITDLWLHEKSRPRTCDPVFDKWKKAGFQTKTLTWQRIALAIDASEIRLARYLAKALPAKDKAYFDEWLNVRKQPETVSANAVSQGHPYRQQALTDGIKKLARKDLPKALSAWEKLKHNGIDEPVLVSSIERTLALQFLSKPTEDRFDYLVFAEPCDQDTKLQEIRIRAALLHNQWDEVLKWLDRLPETLRDNDRWTYWRARSLQMTGDEVQANVLFNYLASKRSFYGFLAADISGKDYALNHEDLSVDKQVYTEVSLLPAMQRTKELLALKRYLDARREWYFISTTFDENELLAAAQLAHEWQWHDRAILTLAKAKSWDDLSIRFPIEHKQHVFKEAENNKIDPAWVFAMMRQESAFMNDAQSPVGALGLMQLMPRTAKSVAKTLKQRKPSKHDLFKPEKNIKLGTAYLKQVYDRFDQHAVLAIAAYNAGPHRVQRWLPENSMQADVWIELVPFKETRNYLKSVLAYTVIYADKLGMDKLRISDRMPVVAVLGTGNLVTAMKQ